MTRLSLRNSWLKFFKFAGKVAITLEECVEYGLLKHVSSWTWKHLILPDFVLPSSGLCLGSKGFRPTSILCCVRVVRKHARNKWITFLSTSDHSDDFN